MTTQTSHRNETRTATFNLLLRHGAAHLWPPAIVDVALNAVCDTPVQSLDELIARDAFRAGLGQRLRLMPSLAAIVLTGPSLLDVLRTGDEVYVRTFLNGVRRKVVGQISDPVLAEEVHEMIRHRFHLMIGNYRPFTTNSDHVAVTCGFKAYMEIYLPGKVRGPAIKAIQRHHLVVRTVRALDRNWIRNPQLNPMVAWR